MTSPTKSPAHPKSTLLQQLSDLHEERVRTWDPAALKINIDQRKHLVEQAKTAKFPAVGEILSSFTVTEVDQGDLTLEQLTSNGAAALIFFRFATCPACNIALPYYRDQLWPGLQELGITLTAISPQVPGKLRDIKQRHELLFNVATDADNTLARSLGILYEFDDASKQSALKKGTPIGDVTGTGTWELPQPTVLLIDRNLVIRFADTSPDWLVRTEAAPILAAAGNLLLDKAA